MSESEESTHAWADTNVLLATVCEDSSEVSSE